ncbi:putative DNA binding domain-containing protein [Asticcacaulis excentricus]|uniref:Phage protein n=1 Tax=Asticcacaulis excentricus TaxID=78587 RepID=A0A3G9G9D0_9CAUL|nr:putative DNA binding domain-containing protein [Asticcacaulis excentricus]BBF82615.1 phage protein [Asticcacaulis excentricus]
MPTLKDLEPLLTEPCEDLAVEYKDWINLTTNEHKAVLAKAAIALVNHGGGFITIGFAETAAGLTSNERPAAIPEITQDAVNAAIQRYATPAFHCRMFNVTHPVTGIVHPVISVPPTLTVPVMSKRDCNNVINQARCYIRKPGPKSEEAHTPEEWRDLLNRCLRAGRDDMLDAIRAIVSGRVEPQGVEADNRARLIDFCTLSKARWEELIADLPADAPSRMPLGRYELGFALLGATPLPGLGVTQDALDNARRIKLTGWSPFLRMSTPGWEPYPHDAYVEAWVGRPVGDRIRQPAHADFWRVSPEGMLYTVRGYAEDSLERYAPGAVFDVTLPVWRVAEALLFARRMAEAFEGVDAIAIWCKFSGLAGRALVSMTGDQPVFGDDVCRTPEIVLEGQATLVQIDDTLVEVMQQLLSPLYERFNFFRLEQRLVEGETAKLLRGI